MPYPVSHVLFFLLCVGVVAVYALAIPLFYRKLSSSDIKKVLLLLFVGCLSSLLPDFIVIYNFFVKGTMEHCWIGAIPTHSIFFSFSAVLFGTVTGYIIYRKFSLAAYLGLFAWSAFLSHLLLDDIDENGVNYFYPVYNKPVSVFSYMGISFTEVSFFHYLIVSFASVSFVCIVFLMALVALNHFGFDFRYRFEN